MNRTYIFFRFFVILFYANLSFGQGDSSIKKSAIAKNTIFVEGLGNGGLYSLNFDRIVLIKNSMKLSGRIGLSYYIKLKNLFTYPLEVNLMYGKKGHIEVGIAYTPVFTLYKKDLLKLYDVYAFSGIRIGYRYQVLDGGLFFRLGFIPYIHFPKFMNSRKEYPIVWMGLSVGYTFKK